MSHKTFAETLEALRYGTLHDELSDELNKVVNACQETGKVAELSLTLKLKPGKAGQIEIIDSMKSKIPEGEKGSTIMFSTPDGNLTREDPRQLSIDGLRKIADHAPGELRKV